MSTKLLDISETAARLRISKSTVRRLIKKGQLASVKILTRVNVSDAEIEAFIQRNSNEGPHE